MSALSSLASVMLEAVLTACVFAGVAVSAGGFVSPGSGFDGTWTVNGRLIVSPASDRTSTV